MGSYFIKKRKHFDSFDKFCHKVDILSQGDQSSGLQMGLARLDK